MVYVSHDLGAIAQVCDRVIVMYAGEIVLEGPVRKILKEPIHPYTYGLLKSIPKLSLSGLPDSMPGSQPQPGNMWEKAVVFMIGVIFQIINVKLMFLN